jgi:hypothetical protein
MLIILDAQETQMILELQSRDRGLVIRTSKLRGIVVVVDIIQDARCELLDRPSALDLHSSSSPGSSSTFSLITP